MAQESECWVLHVGGLWLRACHREVFPSVNRRQLAAWLAAHGDLTTSPGAARGRVIDAWPPADEDRSRRQNLPGDHYGFVSLVQNPSGVDLVGWSHGELAAVEAKGVTRRSTVQRQIAAALRDVDKLEELLRFQRVTAWLLVDARPNDEARRLASGLVSRLLRRDGWPARVNLVLVSAAVGPIKSCITCGYAPTPATSPSSDFVRDAAEERRHRGHDLRSSSRPAEGVDPIVLRLDPTRPDNELVRSLARFPHLALP